MFSELAKQDLIALRQQGFRPTDEDVIKLNDLALAIERGKNTTPANMPRIGFAGNVILHEPTIGALIWWNQYGVEATTNVKQKMLTYYFMLANSRQLDVLNKLEKPHDINKAVKKWSRTIDATDAELWRALWYVKYGYENPDSEITGKEPDDDEMLDSLWALVCSASGMLNLPPEELKTQTRSTLTTLMIKASVKAGCPLKCSVANKYIAYKRLLKEIEDRGKNNG